MKKLLLIAFSASALAACGQNNSAPLLEGREIVDAPVAGQNCLGVLELDIRQGSFSIDVFEHARNNSNASQLVVPVFQEDYARLSEGQRLQSDFRTGSFLLNGGKVSNRHVTVQRKLGYVCA